MELDGYSFVLLKRGPRALEFSDDELDRLQEQHLAHLDAMKEQGHLLVAGPFSDQPDDSLRGFCLYRTASRRRAASPSPIPPCGPGAWPWRSWAGGRSADHCRSDVTWRRRAASGRPAAVRR
jgi:uncharacterized protein YciI